jgi:beta-aspartyl-peptidase (threonine type)
MLGRIVVHGGAGFWRKDLRRGLRGVNTAALEGLEIIQRHGSAVDAVEAAVSTMEDDPVFNAGRGSSLTAAGTVEMDAAIMDGRDLSAGAVALVRRVKNPITLARIVMDRTDHVLLAGPQAEHLAEVFFLPTVDPVTPRRLRLLRTVKKRLGSRDRWVEKNMKLLAAHPEILRKDTVGAVAVDDQGNFAAAASTGGLTMKLPGRIGDTPQIGSGLYSDNAAGSATATGLGEIAIKLVLSKTVCLLMQKGSSAQAASTFAITDASRRLRGEAGVIAIDRAGRVAAVHNTPLMPWALATSRMSKPRSWPHGRIVAPVRTTA